MPSLTTDTWDAPAACSRCNSTSGQRSSPFRVEAVPSVIESPNATTTFVSSGASMSTASSRYQDAVLNGKSVTPSVFPFAPAPGGVR